MGWLINFPALPNWVSIFQNSTGGFSTMSFTLQEHTFPVAWFSMCRKCPLCSIWDNPISRSPFKVPVARLLVLKYTLLPILKKVVSCPWSFVWSWNDSHLRSSWQRPMQVCGLLSSTFQNWDLPRIIASVPIVGEEVNLDPFYRPKRLVFLL